MVLLVNDEGGLHSCGVMLLFEIEGSFNCVVLQLLRVGTLLMMLIDGGCFSLEDLGLFVCSFLPSLLRKVH